MSEEYIIHDHAVSTGSAERRPRSEKPAFIPRPLVQTNRAFLVVTITAGLLLHHAILLLPLITGLIGLVFRRNPVILAGRPFLHKSPDHYHWEDPSDQRFNQWIATILVSGSLLAFAAGYPVAGYVFGGMVILAAGIALLGFCVGCYIHFQYRQWQYKRSQGATE